MDVGEDTTLGDGDAAHELVELLVVADGKLEVAGIDPGLLVVAGGVAGKLKDLGSKVLHDCGEVDGGTASDAGAVRAVLEVPVDTSDRELKASPGGPGLAFGFGFTTGFAAARHDE